MLDVLVTVMNNHYKKLREQKTQALETRT
jgi:hypothetical protein